MIILLVYKASDADRDERIRQHEKMKRERRDCRLDDNFPEVADEEIHGVEQECVLRGFGIGVYVIEDCRHIHKKLRENAPKVLYVPEKDEQRRKNQPHADVEAGEQNNRVDQHNPAPCEGNSIKNAEEHKDAERETEVDEALHVFRQQEEILGDVDFCEYSGISHKRAHTLRCRFVEESKHEVAAEQISSIVRRSAPEELREHQPHDEQHHERREQAPHCAEDSSLVFLFKVTLHQFFEEKLVLPKLKIHFI